jgi:hypothetical protein
MVEKSVRFENERAQQGFTQVSNALLRDASLSVNARFLWTLLASYAWQDESCFPGQEGLGEVMQLTDRSVRTYLSELAGAGLLRVTRRGLGKTNVYTLLAMSQTGRVVPPGSDAHNRSERKLASGEEDTEKKTQKKKKNTSPTPPAERSEFSEWLGHHHELTGSAVPRAGTTRRAKLAAIFDRLAGEGHELEDFRAASEGVWALPHMREGGHIEPENVLRVQKFGQYVSVGRRARSENGDWTRSQTDWTRFDDGGGES